MSNDSAGSALLYAALLMLPLSALAARRLGWRANAKMALVWAAIFGVAILLFVERDRFGAIATDVRRAFDPEAGETRGGTVRIPMAEDGHFWVRAVVNGTSLRFLVDSGATTTSLNEADARRAGVAIGSGLVSGIAVPIDTANGTVMAQRGDVARFRIGSIERQDMHVIVAEAFGTTNVLGMNFLSSLVGWSVEGRTLVLTP